MRRLLLIAALALLTPHLAWAAPVKALKITVLSTMLAHDGVGEWGYAALVEVDGRRILFDTGARPQTDRISVVLPIPLRPSRPTTSPAWTCRSIPKSIAKTKSAIAIRFTSANISKKYGRLTARSVASFT